MIFKVENKGRAVLGLLGVFIAIMFILFSMGNTNWILWTAAGMAIFLGVFLWVEAGWLTYLKRSEYRKIGLGDIIVWLSFIIGTALILMGISLIQGLGSVLPTGIVAWLTSRGVWVAVIAGLLFVYHAFAKKPS